MKFRQTSYTVNLYMRWLTYADCFLMVANFPRFQYNRNRTLCASFHDYYKIWTRQDIAHHSLDDHNITISSLSPLFTPYSLHTGRLSPLTPANPHRKALASETLASELHLYNWYSSFKSQNLCKFQLITKSWGWVSYYFVLLSISVALSHFDFFEIE